MSIFGTGILDRSAKSSVTLVDFFWGRFGDTEKNHRRFADVEGPVNAFGKTWLSFPSMEIALPKMTGTLAEEKAIVSLPLIKDFFTDYISDGMPFAPTRVHIMEIVSGRDELILDPDTERPEVIHLFKGEVSMGIRHPGGKRNRVRIEAKSVKTQLKNMTMGILATNTCAHPHGGTGCYMDLSLQNDPIHGRRSIIGSAYIASIIDGTKVRIRSDTQNNDITTKALTYWDEGYIEIEGLRLKIRKWDKGTNDFWLMNQPRVALLGNSNLGDLVRGCDKTVTACRFFDNEEFFGGYGFGTPDYNPLFEIKS